MPEPVSRRALQARQTRRDILHAARHLFAERGYAGTTVRDIAGAAGVSAQTVYDSVGAKQALVAQLNDLVDEEADIRGIAQAAFGSGDAAEICGAPARITRSILENCGDIARALVTGAASEPEIAVVLAEGRRRHLSGAGRMVGALVEQGALSASIDADAATETMAALSDIGFGMMLRDAYGWSLEQIEEWIAATTRQALLQGPGEVRSRPAG